MKKIFKYQLEITAVQSIQIPFGAEILCIQSQNENPCIWALVDENNTAEKRSFQMFGTGRPINEDVKRNYIGTFQVENRSLVFHVFENL